MKRILFIILFLAMAANAWGFDYQFNQYMQQQKQYQQRQLELQQQQIDQQRRYQQQQRPKFNYTPPQSYKIDSPNFGESFMDGYEQGLKLRIMQEQLKQLRKQNGENN